MRLTIFNGSPRGEDSNTRVLLEHFINGFTATSGNTYELAYLIKKDNGNSVRLFQEAEHVLLAFPLYYDAMPGHVKTFIESLEPFCGRRNDLEIAFIVQSGYPEAVHSASLKPYLEGLVKQLGCKYTGTVALGGVEVIRATPALSNKRLFESFRKLGEVFGKTGALDRQVVAKLAKPEKYSEFQVKFLNLAANILCWHPLLKKNHAYERRFAKPDTAGLESV